MNSNLIPNNYTLFFFFHEWFHCLGRNGSELIRSPEWKHSRPLLLQTWPTAEQHQCDQLICEKGAGPHPRPPESGSPQNWDLLSGCTEVREAPLIVFQAGMFTRCESKLRKTEKEAVKGWNEGYTYSQVALSPRSVVPSSDVDRPI